MTLEEEAAVFKALGHPSRLAMARALGDGERCVCDLQTLVGSDLSTVSKHLSVLRAAGIVDSRKEGKSVYYRLRLGCLSTFLACLEEDAAEEGSYCSARAGGCSCGSSRTCRHNG